MKILMIVHAYYLKDARVRRYAELLARRGHRVDVLCLREDPGEPDQEVCEGVHIHRIRVTRKRGGPSRYIVEYLRSALKMMWRANVRQWRTGKYDVVHVHNFPNFLVFSALFQKLAGSRILLDVHDPMPELFRSKFTWDDHSSFLRALVAEERVSLSFAHSVIAANHVFKDILVGRGCPPQKVTVIMNSPDQSLFRPVKTKRIGQSNDEFVVLYIGTIAKRYGIDTVLDAIVELNKGLDVPRVVFKVIPKIKNEGRDQDLLTARVKELGLDRQFVLLDPVPYDHMPGIIGTADLAVYTPRPDIHMDIALSLKIPEVVACGVPVVASRLSVLERYFGEESLFMCEPGNALDCADKIRTVMTSPDEARRRTGRAMEKLALMRWEIQERAYLDLIEGTN